MTDRWKLALGLVVSGSVANTAVDAGSFDVPGPYAVGSRHTLIHTRDGGRTLPVELWYPATNAARDEPVAGFPVEEFQTEPRRT